MKYKYEGNLRNTPLLRRNWPNISRDFSIAAMLINDQHDMRSSLTFDFLPFLFSCDHFLASFRLKITKVKRNWGQSRNWEGERRLNCAGADKTDKTARRPFSKKTLRFASCAPAAWHRNCSPAVVASRLVYSSSCCNTPHNLLKC